MSIVQEVKGSFREIVGDVTGVFSVIIAIAVFTIILPILFQLTALLKGFQGAMYTTKETGQTQGQTQPIVTVKTT